MQIPPELAALTRKSLIAFARKNWTHADPDKGKAARSAFRYAKNGDPDCARAILARAGLAPDAPSLLPRQTPLFDSMPVIHEED